MNDTAGSLDPSNPTPIQAETELFQRDVSAWVNVVDCSRQSLTVTDLIDLSSIAEQCVKELRLVSDELKAEIASRMESRSMKETTIQMPDGSNVILTKDVRVSRTKVQSAELLKAVEQIAASQQHRLDTTTGELKDDAESRIDLVKRAFRFEPRWSIIKELGIQDDEFCQKAYKATVTIDKEKK